MKTQKILLAAFLLLFVSFGANAQNEPKVTFLPHAEEGFLRMMVTDHDGEALTIKFKKGNYTITKDRIKPDGEGFIKLYDIRNLKEGNYTLEVSNKSTTVKNEFNIGYGTPVWAQYWNNKLNNNSRLAVLAVQDSLAQTSGN